MCHRETMADLKVELEMEKKLVQDDIIKMRNEILPELKNMKEEIGREKEKYEMKVKEIYKEMVDEHKARLGYLTRIHKDRMNILATIRDANLAKFDEYSKEILTEINSCKERISKSEQAIRKNDFASLVNLSDSKMQLSDKEKTRKLPEPPSFEPGNVHSIGEIFGRLQIPPPPSISKPFKLTSVSIVSEFKCPLEGYPTISITKEGDVWLGGNDSRELVMVDIKGQVLKRRKIQNRPVALAVMECGDVIISPDSADSRSVSRLLTDDREQDVFDSPSASIGVSVTTDQKLLVCTTDGRVIRVYCDGTNAKQIYKGAGYGSTSHAVENSVGIIYISDCTKSAVLMINKDGKALSTITHTTGGQQLALPWGLVVDKMDNVLFPDYSNNCVYIIDQKQEMWELVGQSHAMKNPQWLAVDNDNNLWITQGDGTVLVVRYLSQ